MSLNSLGNISQSLSIDCFKKKINKNHHLYTKVKKYIFAIKLRSTYIILITI